LTEDELSVRAFAPADWYALCGVYERAATVEMDWRSSDGCAVRQLSEVEDLGEFQHLNTVIVACVEGRVVGFVAWRDRREWRDSGYLSWLYVDPAYHRRGVGDRLLGEAMAALGGQAWTLVASGNEPAINLYRKHGMPVVESRPAANRGHSHTEVRMALPTSRKSDPEVPNFGGWIYGDD
jgi:ribosomal protein S18 acetylase RimI-like enzyme